MSSTDGTPHGIPLNFAFEGNNIYFHCAPDGKKIDLLSANKRVSFCVVGRTEVLPKQFGTRYESVVATGTVEELFSDDKHEGLALLVKKYSFGYISEGLEYIERKIDKTRVFKICLETITGKACR